MPVEFEGLEGVLERLEGIVDETKMGEALQMACLIVESEAVKKAPKVDGILRQSITSRVDGLKGIVFSNLEYAPYVEYGTGLFATGTGGGRTDVPWIYQDEKSGEYYATCGQEPQPYMRPALDENKEKILSLLQEAMIKK
jgi:HK97 gp10 family phage protein